MITLLKELYPFCSSITGNGLRSRLQIIKKHVPINIYEIPTGTKCFDWEIPMEWNIKNAWIKNIKTGEKIIDFQKNNLHIVNYSIPTKTILNFDQLKHHLHFLKKQPNTIPYLTTYYVRDWGFCMTYNEYNKLDRNGDYEIFIDSTLKNGSLSYGDLLIHGKTKKEILFSCYLCHPSMCNDSLSGVVVTIEIIKYLLGLNGNHYFTYRFIFIPETIGSIAYLSKHLKELKSNVIGGYVLTTCGDEGKFTFLKSIDDNSLSNRIGLFILDQNLDNDDENGNSNNNMKYKIREFYTCGSDERQYNSPGVDLNIASLMKTKYTEFKEYHTSDDNFNLVTEKGLNETLQMYKKIIFCFEHNFKYQNINLCEAKLGKYGLYLNSKGLTNYKKELENGDFKKRKPIFEYRKLMYYLNGKRDLVEICKLIKMDFMEIKKAIDKLLEKGLIKKICD